MPKIAQYQPNQVSTQVVNQPRAQSAPKGAFDTPIMQGMVDLAKAGVEIKQRIDTTSAEEAAVNFEREKNDLFFNPESGYFNSQGRDAYDRAQDTVKGIQDLRKKHAKNLTQNARVMFDKVANQHITRGQLEISRHSSAGLKAWEVSTIESQIENTVENAALYWGDSEKLKVQNVLGRQAIFDSAKMQGLSFEATAEKVQTFDSVFARSAIEAATSTSAAQGKVLLEKFDKQLEGPDKIKMQNLIIKKEKTEKTASDAKVAVTTATRLNDQYDERNDIIAEVEKIEDDELRKKTMGEAMSQFSRKKQAESEFQANSFEEGNDTIVKTGSIESWKAANPDRWESLTEVQKRKLESGGVATSDMIVYSDLFLLPKAELAKINPADYIHKLAKSEYKSLTAAIRDARGIGSKQDKVDHQTGRTRTAQTTSAAEKLFGKKSTWAKNKDKIEKVNGFYSLLDEEVRFRESEKGSKLTSEEFTDVLNGLTREVTIEGRIWDSDLDINDIPEDDRKTLTKFLRDNNIPVTADNLIKAHKQATK